jgi:hypothetical protein
VTGQPTLTSRAETLPLKELGRSQEDRRTADEFEAALWRETDRSLAADPSRWPWTSTQRRRRVAAGC